MKVATVPRDDMYVGQIPKIRISTLDDAAFGDMIFGPNGAYWRSAKDNNYLYLPWETLKGLFEANGSLKTNGALKPS
ncbi:MAG: hypothetical protein ABWZ40_14590 [Caulobacterales bacterium]